MLPQKTKYERFVYMISYRIDSRHFDIETGKIIQPKLVLPDPQTGEPKDCAKLFPIFFSNLQKSYEWVIKDFAPKYINTSETKDIYYEKVRRKLISHGHFIFKFKFNTDKGQFDLNFRITKHLIQ